MLWNTCAIFPVRTRTKYKRYTARTLNSSPSMPKNVCASSNAFCKYGPCGIHIEDNSSQARWRCAWMHLDNSQIPAIAIFSFFSFRSVKVCGVPSMPNKKKTSISNLVLSDALALHSWQFFVDIVDIVVNIAGNVDIICLCQSVPQSLYSHFILPLYYWLDRLTWQRLFSK